MQEGTVKRIDKQGIDRQTTYTVYNYKAIERKHWRNIAVQRLHKWNRKTKQTF